MKEYIDKEYLRGWTLIPPPTPSGKIIPRSVDELPTKVLEVPTPPPVKDPWNWCFNSKPPESELVILMCLEERGDYPNSYTVSGWRLGRDYIIDNQLCADEVVAWQYLPDAWKPKKIMEMLHDGR